MEKEKTQASLEAFRQNKELIRVEYEEPFSRMMDLIRSRESLIEKAAGIEAMDVSTIPVTYNGITFSITKEDALKQLREEIARMDADSEECKKRTIEYIRNL